MKISSRSEHKHPPKGPGSFQTHPLLVAYQEMIQSRVDLGWRCSLLTFEFEPLAGDEATRIKQIQRFLEIFYALALTRFVRHPKRCALTDLPLMLSMADYPVVKFSKINRIATNNDGLHAHALLAIPPKSRSQSTAHSVFSQYEQLFRRKCHLQTLDVRAVVETPAGVVKYVLKSLELRRFDDSNIWLLPKACSEVKQPAYAASRRHRREGTPKLNLNFGNGKSGAVPGPLLPVRKCTGQL